LAHHWIDSDFALGIVPWVYKNTSADSGRCKLVVRCASMAVPYDNSDITYIGLNKIQRKTKSQITSYKSLYI
jgi:hypothetical protein